MDKEFIPYEQALGLKELGFDENCMAMYHLNKIDGITKSELILKEANTNISDVFTRAPLYQQAFRWFRDSIITELTINEKGDYIQGNFTLIPLIFLNKYEIQVINLSTSYYFSKVGGRDGIPFYREPTHRYYDSANSFEEAELACLKRLIEIVKNK